MPITQHNYRLGREQTFNFMDAGGVRIQNNDVKSVSCTFETSAEADVTTRASGNESEFYPVRKNTQFEVVVLNHTCQLHATGLVFISTVENNRLLGVSGATGFGHFYVSNISEPQDNDGAIEYTITLRRTHLANLVILPN